MSKLAKHKLFARDQYSLGITGWEIIIRQKSWNEMDTEAIVTAVVQFNKRPIWPKECSAIDWQRIVESLWTISLHEALHALDDCGDIINIPA